MTRPALRDHTLTLSYSLTQSHTISHIPAPTPPIPPKVGLPEARRREAQFLAHHHPAYQGLTNMGMSHLASRLSHILEGEIRHQLPAIQRVLQARWVGWMGWVGDVGGCYATSVQCRKFLICMVCLCCAVVPGVHLPGLLAPFIDRHCIDPTAAYTGWRAG